MKKTKTKQRMIKVSKEQTQQLRADREVIAKELPLLVAKHKRLREAAADCTPSGVLRRAIHTSKFLLHDLAARAQTDMDTLDAFLTGERPLTSDIIDRLAHILKLKLDAVKGKAKTRAAKAG
jgi:hypothetical protein